MRSVDQSVAKYVRSKLDARTLRIATAASYDLHFGPQGRYCMQCEGHPPGHPGGMREECECARDATHPGDYPGWIGALAIVREGLERANLSTLYVDEDSDVSESEPEPFLDCMEEHTHDAGCYAWPGSYWRMERPEWLEATFGELGRELQ